MPDSPDDERDAPASPLLDVDEMVQCEGCETLLDPEYAHIDVEGYLCDECAATAPLAEPDDGPTIEERQARYDIEWSG